MGRRGFLRLCGGAAALSLGCLQPPKPSGPRGGLEAFIEGVSAGDAETLNWILAADAASLGYVSFTMDGLATYDNQLRLQLRWLREPVEVSRDGLEYTIPLREDLRWTDGNQVRAADFVYTMEHLMFAPWLRYTYAGDWMEEVDGAQRFVEPRVVDKNTFTIMRRRASPEFLYTIMGLLVYPEHIARRYEGDAEAFTRAEELNNLSYTGNLGPYRFVEWIRNDKFAVERNPDYYLGKRDGAPYFDRYVVKLFGSPAARHAALEAGDIAYTSVDPPKVGQLIANKAIRIYTVPTNGFLLLDFNQRNGWPALRLTEVRQAISMAISKELLINSVLLGFGEPAFSFIPKVSPLHVDEGLERYGVGELYNKDRAREALRGGGYENIRLRIVTNSGNKTRENVAFLVRQELSEIGVEAEVKFVPWPTLLRKYLMNKTPGSDQPPRFNNGPGAVSEEPWDLLVIGYTTDLKQPSGTEIFFATDGGLNSSGYSNKKVDTFFKRLRSPEALDEGRRRELYAELSRELSSDLPVDFLAFQYVNLGFQTRVKGVEPGISTTYNYQWWRFED